MPVFRPRRQIPYASVEIIVKELERLEKLGVREKTDNSQGFFNRLCQEKNNKIRICADYSTV